jgi:hypothetical protein
MLRTLVPMRFGRVVATRVGPNTWIKTSGHRFSAGPPVAASLDADSCVLVESFKSYSISDIHVDDDSCISVT